MKIPPKIGESFAYLGVECRVAFFEPSIPLGGTINLPARLTSHYLNQIGEICVLDLQGEEQIASLFSEDRR